MTKKRRRQFPRLAVYATSPSEIRRCLEAVETLARVAADLAGIAGMMQEQVERLRVLVDGVGPRRRAARARAPESPPDPEEGGAIDAPPAAPQ